MSCFVQKPPEISDRNKFMSPQGPWTSYFSEKPCFSKNNSPEGFFLGSSVQFLVPKVHKMCVAHWFHSRKELIKTQLLLEKYKIPWIMSHLAGKFPRKNHQQDVEENKKAEL